jgi:hypothetical protein
VLDSTNQPSILKTISEKTAETPLHEETATPSESRLFQGIRIVSFNHFLIGLVGAQFLADLGD